MNEITRRYVIRNTVPDWRVWWARARLLKLHTLLCLSLLHLDDWTDTASTKQAAHIDSQPSLNIKWMSVNIPQMIHNDRRSHDVTAFKTLPTSNKDFAFVLGTINQQDWSWFRRAETMGDIRSLTILVHVTSTMLSSERTDEDPFINSTSDAKLSICPHKQHRNSPDQVIRTTDRLLLQSQNMTRRTCWDVFTRSLDLNKRISRGTWGTPSHPYDNTNVSIWSMMRHILHSTSRGTRRQRSISILQYNTSLKLMLTAIRFSYCLLENGRSVTAPYLFLLRPDQLGWTWAASDL